MITKKEVLHVLRNPSGYSEEYIRKIRLEAADMIEGIDEFKYKLLEELQCVYQKYPEIKKQNSINLNFNNITLE